MGPRQANPFRPGFNQPPIELAGRDSVLAAAREALDIAALDARTPRPVVLVGSRGVGKTVVLGEIAAMAAEAHSWPTVAIEVRPNTPFTDQLVSRLTAVADLFDQVKPGRRLEISEAKVRAGVLGLGGEITMRKTGAASDQAAPLEQVLSRVCETAIAHSSGVVLAVDELQLARRDELADLAASLQQHVPDAWPLMVVVAGLPSIRDPQRSVTYLERGEWHELDLLDDVATLRALTGPARLAGRPFTDRSARALARASGGYPYAIQVFGHHAWRSSAGSDEIGEEHIGVAIEAAGKDLAAGLYSARWHDATPREREYLHAVAGLSDLRDDVTGADVAAHLGKGTAQVSYIRDRLIKKGTLFTEGRTLRFPVPGMGAWIVDQRLD